MVNYEQMYCKMNRAMEKAINILIQAQQECEEQYLAQTGPSGEQETTEQSDR